MSEREFRVSIQRTYFALCLKQIEDYEAVIKLIEEEEKREYPEDQDHFRDMKLNRYQEQSEQLIVAPIISAALTLEAFSFDYAATHLGDSFVKNHIEKLEVPSRFVIATKLITGKDFPVDGQVYENMKKLVKLRNKLVHFKSRKIDMSNRTTDSDFIQPLYEEMRELVHSSTNMLRELCKILDSMHSEKTYYEYSLEPTECYA